MGEERRPSLGHRAPTRAMVLAWADAHTVDISNAEADDLVRRLWHPAAPFEPEAVEQCVTDALLLLAVAPPEQEICQKLSIVNFSVRHSPTVSQRPSISARNALGPREAST